MTELETANQRITELEAELAAMRAGGEPVGYIITNTLVAGDRAIVFPDKADRAPKIFPRTPVYTHPQPAAQDAEERFEELCNRNIALNALVSKLERENAALRELIAEAPSYFAPQYDFEGRKLAWIKSADAAIAAQQGDSHE